MTMKVGDFEFCGQFTSKIEAAEKVIPITTFYVQEADMDFVTINKETAHKLNLIQ